MWIPARVAPWKIAALSLIFIYLFFAEYLPPLRDVYIPYDLGGFHYPLADYAFQSLKSGRFPQWDPTMYSGMPFAANPQAALFYPGTWILFLANIARPVLSFQSLEDFLLLHVWLAFFLCYLWLHRKLSVFASICGASVFAFGGYAMFNLQHLGLIVAYAWIPLGMLGVDEMDETDSWRPMWKVAAASALAFLGGYTPTWFAAVTCMFTYGLIRRNGWRTGIKTALALGYSLLLVCVQLLPAMTFSALRVPEFRYGSGITELAFYLSYFVPNFWDFSLSTPIATNPFREYLYLGAPGTCGLLLLLFYRRPRNAWSALPLLAVFLVTIVIVTNPKWLVSEALQHAMLLSQVIRDYYFLIGLSVVAAPLAAIGIDRFLGKQGTTAASGAFLKALMASSAAFCLWLWIAWARDRILKGPASFVDAGLSLALFTAGLFGFRAARSLRGVLALTIILTVATDFKVHGTSTRQNATASMVRLQPAEIPFANTIAVRHMLADRGYRVLTGEFGMNPLDLRHIGLNTPQGFDPLISTAYKTLIERLGKFSTDRMFDIDPANEEALHILGVKYVLTPAQAPVFSKLKSNPDFAVLEPPDTYLKTVEWSKAQPAYGWQTSQTGTLQSIVWEPERRAFTVDSREGGKFHLSEQWHPGWTARIDGAAVKTERWPFDPVHGAFQAVDVPPGRHRVEFTFRDPGLLPGAAVSLLSLAGLIAFVRWPHKTRAV